MRGLEYSFLESWEGWDQVGSIGDMSFYNCKLANHLKGIEPEGTVEILMTLMMSESVVQFDFFGSNGSLETIASKAFRIKAVIEEEIPYE